MKYHCSENGAIRLYDRDVGQLFRPQGLWYAEGTSWVEYADRSKPAHAKAYPHLFALNTSGANVLTLDTVHMYDAFTMLYGDDARIRWSKVANDYDGVEITSAMLVGRRPWSRCWDVPSGCVWNATTLRVVGYEYLPQYESGRSLLELRAKGKA